MSLNIMICHEVSLACIVYHLEPFVLFLWSISFSFFDLIVLVGTFLLIPKFIQSEHSHDTQKLLVQVPHKYLYWLTGNLHSLHR